MVIVTSDGGQESSGISNRMCERSDRIEAVGTRKCAAHADAAIGRAHPDQAEPTGWPTDGHTGVCAQPAQAEARGNCHPCAARRSPRPVTEVPRVSRIAIEFIEPGDT